MVEKVHLIAALTLCSFVFGLGCWLQSIGASMTHFGGIGICGFALAMALGAVVQYKERVRRPRLQLAPARRKSH